MRGASTPRRRRVSAPLLIAAACVVLLVAGGCATRRGDRLLVARSTVAREPTDIWAVRPGDAMDDSTLVQRDAQGPVNVVTRTSDGSLLVNTLALGWKDELLVATFDDESQQLVATTPGGDPLRMSRGEQLEVIVVNRGVFTVDEEGCRLARRVEKTEAVGAGACSISDDDRWVASWPREGGALEVRDLRTGDLRTVDGQFIQAVALSHDAVVLAVETATDGQSAVAKVVDSRSGEVIATTEPAEFIQGLPPTVGSESFVAIQQRDGVPSLVEIGTDGTVTTIVVGEPGRPLLPVTVAEGVDYLEVGDDGTSTLFHWEPGAKPEKVIAGELTATSLGGGRVLVSRQMERGLELWSVVGGELSNEPIHRLATDASEHLTLDRVLVHNGTALVLVGSPAGSSLLQLDVSRLNPDADTSHTSLRDWADLRLWSVDTDGTAVLVGLREPDAEQQALLVVGPKGAEPEVRDRAGEIRRGFIHEGIVYYTTADSDGTATVWSVPAVARGDGGRPERLWRDAQLVGASWEENGGAADSFTVDPVLLGEQGGGDPGTEG